ncbi:hypothetical protein [Corallococcus sicarius]|nr:hypothetical protein [Corallococcus sicarius]
MGFLGVSVHDAEVTGVRMNREKELLQLELVLHTLETVWVEFHGTEEWWLSPLVTQNVLFDIREWRAGMNGTAKYCADMELDPSWTKRVLAGELTLYELDPSVGLRGFVVARTATVKRTVRDSDGGSVQGVCAELEHVLREGWSRRIENGSILVVGPDSPDFISEVWRIARFIAYDAYVGIERLDAPDRAYRLTSRSGTGLEFQVTFRADGRTLDESSSGSTP